ncbi:allantoin permease [Saccharomycopsis crataegensis]|uniref:Allantoin permease n=1 Tax=Saccharomycopsis crataegensis TaxID=43959 RepID=A0AAV5QI84_9ASCO|nr:allantoin permease [Saccharomycopsis crataegensis]
MTRTNSGEDARLISRSKTPEEQQFEIIDYDSTNNSQRQKKVSSTTPFSRALKLLRLEHSTADAMPVESARRTWDKTSFVFFWITDSFNINTIQLASTGLLNHTLSTKEVILSILLGYSIVGVFIHISARIGTYNHISFPILCKVSFGLNGAIWPVLNRAVVGGVWYAVQCWIGGQCVQLILKSMFYEYINDDEGNNHGNWSDHFSFEMISFGIFWIVSFFAILIPPHKLKPLLTLKAYVVPFAALGLLGWTLFKAKISDPVEPDYHTSIHESKDHLKFWTFVTSTMNSVANFSSLILNASDFSRFANSPKSIEYTNIICVPVCFTLTSLIGILISSASRKIYGVAYWSPLDVLDRFLKDVDNDETEGIITLSTRIGVLLIAISFIIAQVGTNTANSLGAATGLSCLLPNYITIRRGGIICAMFSLIIQPWRFFESSNKFTVYLSAYSVFLSGIAGVMITDYYIVRRGYLNLIELYKLNGIYSYDQKLKVNWRAYVAYIVAIVPNLPGFVNACGGFGEEKSMIMETIILIYEFSFFVGFGTAMIVYLMLCHWWPVEGIVRDTSFLNLKANWLEEWKYVEDFDSLILDMEEDSSFNNVYD